MTNSSRSTGSSVVRALGAIAAIFLFLGASTLINLQEQVTGVLPAANGGTGGNLSTAASGTYPKANGSGVYAASSLPAAGTGSCTNQVVTANVGDTAPTCSTVAASMSDSSINGFAVTSSTVINPSAATDTKLAEISLPSAYLNTASKSLQLYAHVVQSTGTTQTPTVTYKWKLCTVSGCGSGTVITLATFGASGAMTASTTEHSEIYGYLATVTTGATGTVESSGMALINISSTSGIGSGGAMWNDTQTAVSASIALNGALFLDLTGQFSTQSGSKNGMVARIVLAKPVD